ncbi:MULTISPECIES: TetR/AcrR family transcriptional regulator [unclassified Fusibacter]|uniref:TetR/AcrR family transcriptional regulator n=1 Tax=unclassified Fusibacter TaxID=2624464 RepID=UPI0010131B82|nr:MULTISPECIES: TetR/AcrR family transcriptional regulator [unclassified Fusibacter]MCK8061696.1 TetR/AcrR family transcriptional regulator [Fusibacter sp. A2]NPE23865.1 TetR/AcrR family transcriptional regulator [Fusibacter sp. A1]RXV58541.1 TetR/AcrR family transcriptional regulator [Fusibacter sp. A1]
MKRVSQVEESKGLIVDAFLSLLKEKSYDDIKLAEIADKAGISRMTIHRHFKCKENIITYQIKNVMKMMQEDQIKIKKLTLESEILNRFIVLRSLPHAKLLIHSEEITSIIYDLKKESNNTLASKYLNIYPDKYTIQFISGGIHNMVKEWLISDFDETAKEMTRKIMKVLTLLCMNE